MVNRVYDKEVGLVVGSDHVLGDPVPVIQGDLGPVGLPRLQHGGSHQRLGAPDLADVLDDGGLSGKGLVGLVVLVGL